MSTIEKVMKHKHPFGVFRVFSAEMGKVVQRRKDEYAAKIFAQESTGRLMLRRKEAIIYGFVPMFEDHSGRRDGASSKVLRKELETREHYYGKEEAKVIRQLMSQHKMTKEEVLDDKALRKEIASANRVKSLPKRDGQYRETLIKWAMKEKNLTRKEVLRKRKVMEIINHEICKYPHQRMSRRQFLKSI